MKNIKGYFKKPEKEEPDLLGDIVQVHKLVEDLTDIKTTVEQKIQDIEKVSHETIQITEENTRKIDDKIKEVEATGVQMIQDIRDIPHFKGDPGKDAEPVDTQKIIDEVHAKIKVPEINEKSLINKVISALPENKASLKIIKEEFKADPEEIAEEISKFSPDKFQLTTAHIKDLDLKLQNLDRGGKGYVHGGGFNNIYSGGSLVSNGLTGLNFTGSGVNSVTKDNVTGIITVNITGGGGGGTVNSVVGTANRITIDSTDPANPIVNIAATYVGQASITTLGTITTGTWHGTAIGALYGGTGIDSSASTGVAQVNAGTWSISTALANGTTATTQSALDNSTKVSTTAYVDAAVAAITGFVPTTRTLTINGSAQTLAADRTWTITTTGTANRITVSGGAGLTPTVDIAATYVGQSSITTLGTITTGVWNGTKIGLAYGGTNADLSATGGTAQYLKQATAGAAITVGTIPASDIASGAALTRTNDTNITLTLGGSPTTALLTATSMTMGWSGTLSLARGGTGAALSDPGADTLLGWDDTDNSTTFITIGTNLTYDHATHTLSATGGGGSTDAYAETPSGTVNSSNVTFTLAHTPADTDGVLVLLDGVTQYNGIDYTVSGSTITFSVAPVTGSSIFAYYNTFTSTGQVTLNATQTLTNKRITRRLVTTNAPGATPTTNTDNVDVMNFTGLATAITSMTTNLSGTPVDGDLLEFRFTDNGTARAITWGASFTATTVPLPTTTVLSTMLRVGFEWSGSTWNCIATC